MNYAKNIVRCAKCATIRYNRTAPVVTGASKNIGDDLAFSYQVQATNFPYAYGAIGLPAGLSINTGTGLITGTITGASLGTVYTVTLSATNVYGTGNNTLTLTVVGVMSVIFSKDSSYTNTTLGSAIVQLDGGNVQNITFGTTYKFITGVYYKLSVVNGNERPDVGIDIAFTFTGTMANYKTGSQFNYVVAGSAGGGGLPYGQFYFGTNLYTNDATFSQAHNASLTSISNSVTSQFIALTSEGSGNYNVTNYYADCTLNL